MHKKTLYDRITHHINNLTFILSITIVLSLVIAYRLMSMNHMPLFGSLLILNQVLLGLSLLGLIWVSFGRKKSCSHKIDWMVLGFSLSTSLTAILLKNILF
ncbi:MAG: hypothetical protein RBQ91_02335 [Acholeplasma sp.]|nr:hypothetical protein [Acholeplasma sp.]